MVGFRRKDWLVGRGMAASGMSRGWQMNTSLLNFAAGKRPPVSSGKRERGTEKRDKQKEKKNNKKRTKTIQQAYSEPPTQRHCSVGGGGVARGGRKIRRGSARKKRGRKRRAQATAQRQKQKPSAADFRRRGDQKNNQKENTSHLHEHQWRSAGWTKASVRLLGCGRGIDESWKAGNNGRETKAVGRAASQPADRERANPVRVCPAAVRRPPLFRPSAQGLRRRRPACLPPNLCRRRRRSRVE